MLGLYITYIKVLVLCFTDIKYFYKKCLGDIYRQKRKKDWLVLEVFFYCCFSISANRNSFVSQMLYNIKRNCNG